MPQKETYNPPGPVSKAEQKIYADVYDVLLIGMLISTVLFAFGVVLALVHPHFIPLTRDYVLKNYDAATFFKGLAALRPGAYMMLATVLLILTPVVRVLISIYAFFAEGDRKYTLVTGIVFLVIVLTVVLGRLGLK